MFLKLISDGFFSYLLTLFSCRGYTALNGTITVNGELERIQMEVIVAYFKVLSQHMPKHEPQKTQSI